MANPIRSCPNNRAVTSFPWHHDWQQVIKVHAWLLDNVLFDLTHIDFCIGHVNFKLRYADPQAFMSFSANPEPSSWWSVDYISEISSILQILMGYLHWTKLSLCVHRRHKKTDSSKKKDFPLIFRQFNFLHFKQVKYCITVHSGRLFVFWCKAIPSDVCAIRRVNTNCFLSLKYQGSVYTKEKKSKLYQIYSHFL